MLTFKYSGGLSTVTWENQVPLICGTIDNMASVFASQDLTGESPCPVSCRSHYFTRCSVYKEIKTISYIVSDICSSFMNMIILLRNNNVMLHILLLHTDGRLSPYCRPHGIVWRRLGGSTEGRRQSHLLCKESLSLLHRHTHSMSSCFSS